MTTVPNLYAFATKELAQDATVAYLLAWADPAYREAHPRLHSLGTELLRSLLQTQKVDLPQIETLCIETQVNRIDLVVQINAGEDGILLLIEDKVNTQERSAQKIERNKETAEQEYSGQHDCLVAVYLKTGNESEASLLDEDICGRFMRRDLLGVLNGFQDTGNVIVDDFRTHLQGWEDETNGWESVSYDDWAWPQWEGFYTEIERRWGGDCGWGYVSNRAGGFLGCWLGFTYIGTENRYADLYMQIHDALRLTVRLGSGTAMDKVRAPIMYQVLETLYEETSDDICIEKAGTFRAAFLRRLQTSRLMNKALGLPLTPTAS